MLVVSQNMPSFDSYCDCNVSIRQDTIPVSMTPLSDELFDNNSTDNSHYDVTTKAGKLRTNRVHEQNSRTIERLHFKTTRTCFQEIVIYVCTHLYRNTKHFSVIKSFISLHDRKGGVGVSIRQNMNLGTNMCGSPQSQTTQILCCYFNVRITFAGIYHYLELLSIG